MLKFKRKFRRLKVNYDSGICHYSNSWNIFKNGGRVKNVEYSTEILRESEIITDKSTSSPPTRIRRAENWSVLSCRRLQKMNWMCLDTPGACFWGHSEPEMSCGRRPDCWRYLGWGYLKLETIRNTWFKLYWKVNGSTYSNAFSKWLSSFRTHNYTSLTMERFVRVPFV